MEKETRNFYIHMIIMASICIIFDVYFEFTEEEDILKAAEEYSLNLFYASTIMIVLYYFIRLWPKYAKIISEKKKVSKRLSKKFIINHMANAVGDSIALFFDLWSMGVISIFFWGYGGAFHGDYETTIFWVRYATYGVIPFLLITGYLCRMKKI